MSAFEEYGILPEIGQMLEEMEWFLPTDIQAEAIPVIMGGGDVLMAAETRSGKTGAISIPLLQIVWETLRDINSGKIAAGQSPKQWRLSCTDRSNGLAITPDGLSCQSKERKKWHGCRATTGVWDWGKYYYEATVAEGGVCRVGWSTEQASLELGTDKFGYGYGAMGKKSHNKRFQSYGGKFGQGDVIGCLLNLERAEIGFTKNGISLGTAFEITCEDIRHVNFFPAVALHNAEMSFNFGDTDFKYPVPNGYSPISKAPHGKVVINPNTGSEGDSHVSNPQPNAPQAIVIEPSRELAEQTFNQVQTFKRYLKEPEVRVLLLIGGVNITDQIEELQRGVDIIIGTPGRLDDLIANGTIILSSCRYFVLDEADGLLKHGYMELIYRIHKKIPKITADDHRLQMIICSATLDSSEVQNFAESLMHFPTWIDLKGEDVIPDTVHHVVYMIDPRKDQSWHWLSRHVQTDGVHALDNVCPGSDTAESLSEAVKRLKGEYTLNAIKEYNMDRAIIFCRTKLDCDNLERYLMQACGMQYSFACLHRSRNSRERKVNLAKFKNSMVNFLICTDVATRGVDVSGLPFIINVTLPDEKSNYVHRIGRVGRAERMGLAISLVSTVPEKVWYHGQWCASRGKNCWNTNLTDVKGCCMWYDEKMYLAEIEDHLNVTIQQIDKNLKVPMNDFDGKVTYGEKRLNTGTGYKDHVEQLTPVVLELAKLEREAQNLFLKRMVVQ
ncbi:ATP-dependent RNA helicase Ddx1 isoform X2 [Armigeres subalbatus]|uniref:ATP-dependent RNA helicase Ddx1 isoform X2 n=1 Tax=Armigeres subalbatus TaxID=124917 RepID=UPI002ED64B3C